MSANTVEVVLKEVKDDKTRLEMVGHVEGKLYGAVNQIELKAKCRLDRASQRIDWFAMRVKQTREASLVERGMDVTVLVQMKISQKESSESLSDEALRDVTLTPTDAICKMEYESPEGGWRLLHDRLWFLTEHYRDLDVFHRVDAGVDIALCKISPLAQVEPAKLPSLAQFQADVQQALGKNFGEFVEAGQYVGDANYRIFRVVAKGTDGEAPVRWQYDHVSDEQGRQAAFAFRVEEKRVEAFGKSGDQMVDSVRFVEKKPSESPKP